MERADPPPREPSARHAANADWAYPTSPISFTNMPKPRVYIETTIPSFYFETRQEDDLITWRTATRAWWDQHRHAYELVTSALVLFELEPAPVAKKSAAIRLLDGIPLLQNLPVVHEVAAHYIDHKLMPGGASADAAHLAMASVHGIEFLLTWNCRHLANANKAQHLRVLNNRLGLSVPILSTPLNLVPEIDR